MGILLNSGNTEFEEAVNAEIYVDKTLLIEYANRVLRTPQKYICSLHRTKVYLRESSEKIW